MTVINHSISLIYPRSDYIYMLKTIRCRAIRFAKLPSDIRLGRKNFIRIIQTHRLPKRVRPIINIIRKSTPTCIYSRPYYTHVVYLIKILKFPQHNTMSNTQYAVQQFALCSFNMRIGELFCETKEAVLPYYSKCN